MNKEDIQFLYRYNRWANATTLKCVTPLGAEEFNRSIGGSFPSVRETLVHVMGAEWIWLRRWKGTSPKALFDAAEFPDLNSIKARWPEVENEQMDFVAQMTDATLTQALKYTNLKGIPCEYPLGRVMQHLVNHGSYHRGQVTNFLRQIGAPPAATDLLVYLDVDGRRG